MDEMDFSAILSNTPKEAVAKKASSKVNHAELVKLMADNQAHASGEMTKKLLGLTKASSKTRGNIREAIEAINQVALEGKGNFPRPFIKCVAYGVYQMVRVDSTEEAARHEATQYRAANQKG